MREKGGRGDQEEGRGSKMRDYKEASTLALTAGKKNVHDVGSYSFFDRLSYPLPVDHSTGLLSHLIIRPIVFPDAGERPGTRTSAYKCKTQAYKKCTSRVRVGYMSSLNTLMFS